MLLLPLIETAFAQVTPSRPNIAAETSQSTNVRMTRVKSTLNLSLMGMVCRAIVHGAGQEAHAHSLSVPLANTAQFHNIQLNRLAHQMLI